MAARDPLTPGPDERRPVRQAPARDPLPPGGPRGDWRDEVIGAAGINVLAGIWLIIAPWVLGYSNADPYWNDVIFGIVIGTFALVRASGAYRETLLSWINLAIGVWLFVAAFTIDASAQAQTNDIVLGVVVFVLAAWSIAATPRSLAGTTPRGSGRVVERPRERERERETTLR